MPFLEEAGLVARKRSQEQDEWVRRLIGLYQEQLHYGAEIVELSRLFFQDDLNYNDEGKAILSEAHVRDVLETFREQLRQQEDVNPDILKQVFKATQKQTGQKGKKLFMPVRVALTGSVHGPDLRETLTLIGRDKIERRLARVLDNDSLLVSK